MKRELLDLPRYLYTLIQGEPAILIQRAEGEVGVAQAESCIQSEEPRKVHQLRCLRILHLQFTDSGLFYIPYIRAEVELVRSTRVIVAN